MNPISGIFISDIVGYRVGAMVGCCVCALEGVLVGLLDLATVGSWENCAEGIEVGFKLGLKVGDLDGMGDGFVVGTNVGRNEGVVAGAKVGELLGVSVNTAVGSGVGFGVGHPKLAGGLLESRHTSPRIHEYPTLTLAYTPGSIAHSQPHDTTPTNTSLLSITPLIIRGPPLSPEQASS